MTFQKILALSMLALLLQSAHAASLSLSADGVAVNAGSMGEFTVGYPMLHRSGDKLSKNIEKHTDGRKATLKYEGGGSVTLEIKNATDVSISFNNLPADVDSFRMETLINFNFSNGGKWQIGSVQKDFPKDKPEKPFLFQGTGRSLALTNFEGKKLTFNIPEYSFNQLQDNREWNWKTFCWWFGAPYHPGDRSQTIKIESGAAEGGEKRVILVDPLGQDAQMDFPEKVKSVEELKADVESEKAWFAALNPPAGDIFGGRPESGAKSGLRETGFFHVEKKGERWILVDPAGNPFFHFGLCGFSGGEDYTYIKGRENIYAWLPPNDGEFKAAWHPQPFWNHDAVSFYLANVIRKYGKYDLADQTARMIERVRKLGFNSGGAFSNIPKETREAAHFPYVSSLPVSHWAEFPVTDVPGVDEMLDPFDEKNRENIDNNFAKLAASAADPLLIGYYLSNEPHHEDIPRAVPALNGQHACKRRLVQMLKEKYQTADAFDQAWGTKLGSFEKVVESGLPVNTKAAAEDMKAYTGLFFEEYYRLIAETFHKYDTNHMLIGNRWQPQTANNEQLCGIAGKYMDVISVNYYTYAVDKDYLNRVYKWSGEKAMFLSEFYWSSYKESGLPGGGKEVASQEERGLAYRNYVEQSASLGYVVGIEWFTLIDQARTGRFFQKYNGENGNTGVFSVTDRPWKKMVEEMLKTNYDVYSVASGQRPPFAYDNPRFTMAEGGHKSLLIPRAPGAVKVDGRFEGWPGMPPELISKQHASEGKPGETEAAFRLCWDTRNLYVMVNVTDPTPMKNNLKGENLWNGDGVELFIGSEKPNQTGPLLPGDRHILFSAGNAGNQFQWHFVDSPEQYTCEMVVLPGVDGKSYTLEAAIPWTALKINPELGQTLLLDIAIDDSSDGNTRDRQLMWNGTAKNAADRANWGRAKLGQ